MKKNMNISVLVILGLAIVLGFGYYASIKVQKENVYLFNDKYKAGTVITGDMFVATETDKKLTHEVDYITKDTINDVIGQTIVTDVYQGMPLMSSYISNKNNSAVTLRLTSGKVAYSIPGDSLSLVTSSIKFGDFVNVYSSVEGGDTTGKITKEILPNVRVLDVVRTNVSEDNPQGTLAGITLELDPNDVSKVAFAKDFTKISVGLLKTGNETISIDEANKKVNLTDFLTK